MKMALAQVLTGSSVCFFRGRLLLGSSFQERIIFVWVVLNGHCEYDNHLKTYRQPAYCSIVRSIEDRLIGFTFAISETRDEEDEMKIHPRLYVAPIFPPAREAGK